MLKINNLFLTMDKTEILKDINISFNEGEIIGIIGKSGAGKTALLKVIAGLIKNFSGEILLNDKSIKSIQVKDIQKQITLLLSNNSLDIIDDTVFNYLLQSRKSFKKFLNPFSDVDIQITEEYINLFNLDKFKNKKVLKLSDGIYKKVAVAFPFIKSSDILLMDNPTSNLDIESFSLLQKAIFKYSINGNKIIIIASNDLNFLLQTADKIVIMEEGGITAETSPDHIDTQIIKKIFNTEVLLSRNIYNGKLTVHQFLSGAG
ncbi:MAG: ABC transporter ATP-binding protein [Spirochaetota bacterium]